MNKLWLSASLLAIITIIAAGVSWQATQNKKFSPEGTNLETCKSLVYNDPNAINLLFFSSEKDAEVYSSYLLNREAFEENKDKFNVYYIDNYFPECKLYRSIALFCDSRDLTLKAASCPHDYVFVLKEEDMSIRSSAYGLVGSINTAHPLTVLQHEFGHLFANFAEEYSPADLPAGQPNCKTKCSEFEEYSSNCFPECSDSSHYRSIQNGVMRTLDSDKFGKFNNQVISQIISKLYSSPSSKTTGLAIEEATSCEDQNQLVIDAHYEGNDLNLDKATKVKGCSPRRNIGPSTATILEADNILNSFNKPNYKNIFTDSPSSNSEDNSIDGKTYQSEGDSFSFSIPYTPGNNLIVSDPSNNNRQSSISLSTIGATPCRIE